MRTVPTNHRISRALVASVLVGVTALGVDAAVRREVPRRTFNAGYAVVSRVYDAWTGSPESEDRP
jgi:hypothetical protein